MPTNSDYDCLVMRCCQDFLLYLEKDWDTPETQLAEKNRMLR